SFAIRKLKKKAQCFLIKTRFPLQFYSERRHHYYKIHSNVKTTIQNWELRDLICCVDGNIIARPVKASLSLYRPNNGTETSITLPFAPTTMHSRHNLIAAGGHRGAVTLKSLMDEDAWTHTFKSGMGMNNSIRLFGPEQDVRMAVCNNDETMSIYGFVPGELKELVTLDLSAAVNQVSSGAALACAWNESSDMFAVSSRDGIVYVYDVRQDHQCLAKICSTEARATRNVPRSLQFSKGPIDLLAYAEHVSNINLVDTRTFETRQIVRIGPDDKDTHIAGLTFTHDSRSIFAGTEFEMFQIDIDSIARRQFPHFAFI
ncbi:hypothetical protein BX666DRAFT_2088145, partial [Dichotomocladium elegans]